MLINFYSFIKGIPHLDKPLGQTGLTLIACKLAEVLLGINDFSLVVLYKTSEKSLGSCIKESHRLSLLQGLPPA